MLESTRPRPFDVSASLYPFEDRWFERDGVALHYIDSGEGLPVVFFHGNPTWSFLYRDVIAGLDGVRALAADLPGYGMSEAPPGYGHTPQEHAEWLGAWLDALDLPRFVAVVQDWGGPTGLRAVAERSERVAGLVILNTWCWPADLKMRALSSLLGGPVGRHLQRRWNVFGGAVLRGGMATGADKPDEVFAAYAAPFEPADRRGAPPILARAIGEVGPWLEETWRMLARLEGLPVELVWGMKDAGLGDEQTIARWLQRFPGAPVTRLEGASHFLQEDEPEAIARAVQRVARRASSEPRS